MVCAVLAVFTGGKELIKEAEIMYILKYNA